MPMRFLMRIQIPTAAENAVVSDPIFDEKLRSLFLKVGAQATYSTTQEGRRIDWVVVDIKDAAQIAAVAEPIFRWLKVKPEFLPEMAPKPYFGRIG
jgi:hypothetical protein